jgi:hypothetical protein
MMVRQSLTDVGRNLIGSVVKSSNRPAMRSVDGQLGA